jgi:cell division protein FtsN
VVLVPPSKQVAQGQGSSAATQPATTAPATTPEQPATQAANPQKRKTIFDLFNAGTGSGGATTAAPTQVASAPTQTKQAATPAPQQKAAPAPAQPQASTGGGYVVQLASFRNDTDAKTEYSRLAKDYPSIVGPLKSQIRQTTVGGSTRYQLGLGPLPTRGDATRVCGELIAAGESDCIVRGP